MSATANSLKTQTSTRSNLLIYLGLMGYLVVVKLILEFASVEGVVPSQTALFSWETIGLLALAGGCAVWLAPRTGLPDLWDPRISPRRRLLLPAAAGVGLGVAALIIHAFTGFAQTIADAGGIDSINVGFPASILFYSGGAIYVESFYRLILLTLPLWLIGNVILRKPGRKAVFWAVAIVASLVEPVGQASLVVGHPEVMLGMAVAMYAINIFEALLYWRHGLLAPLAFRVAFYFAWHVAGGLMGI